MWTESPVVEHEEQERCYADGDESGLEAIL